MIEVQECTEKTRNKSRPNNKETSETLKGGDKKGSIGSGVKMEAGGSGVTRKERFGGAQLSGKSFKKTLWDRKFEPLVFHRYLSTKGVSCSLLRNW